MTGQDFQDKLNAIVTDLQTAGKGQRVTVLFRTANNTVQGLALSSDSVGNVNADELGAIQAFINTLKPIADEYTTQLIPVQAASEVFRLAGVPHEAQMAAVTAARQALADSLMNDAEYQRAKMRLDDARNENDYVVARTNYQSKNVVENFGNLGDAKGKYETAPADKKG